MDTCSWLQQPRTSSAPLTWVVSLISLLSLNLWGSISLEWHYLLFGSLILEKHFPGNVEKALLSRASSLLLLSSSRAHIPLHWTACFPRRLWALWRTGLQLWFIAAFHSTRDRVDCVSWHEWVITRSQLRTLLWTFPAHQLGKPQKEYHMLHGFLNPRDGFCRGSSLSLFGNSEKLKHSPLLADFSGFSSWQEMFLNSSMLC